MQNDKILISDPKNYEAHTGELLEFHFKLIGLPGLKTLQQKAIVAKINKDKHMEVKRYYVQNGELVLIIRIIDNPFPIVFAIVGVSSILVGFFVWASLGNVYKILETPGGTLLAGSAGLATAIIAGVAIFFITKR